MSMRAIFSSKLAAATALSGAVYLLVATGGQAGAGASPSVEVHDLVGTPKSFTLVGAGAEDQIVAGSYFVFTEELNRRSTPVANNTGTCTAVTETRFQCAITTTFQGGTVQVAGVSVPAGVVTLAITGGTGRYQGAGGTVRVDTRPAKDLLRFRITMPGRR